jgi:hypothetical protein
MRGFKNAMFVFTAVRVSECCWTKCHLLQIGLRVCFCRDCVASRNVFLIASLFVQDSEDVSLNSCVCEDIRDRDSESLPAGRSGDRILVVARFLRTRPDLL